MSKYSHVLTDKAGSNGRRSARNGFFKLLIFVTLLVSPLLYEGGRVCVARWRSMLGTHSEVDTPIWNHVVSAYRSGADEWQYRVGRRIAPGQWSAGMAVPAVIFVAVASTFFLRNTTR
jgi:hypothetical protein